MKLEITKDDWDVVREYLGKRPNIRQRMHWNAARTNPDISSRHAHYAVTNALRRISNDSRGKKYGNA
ncbi:hypothetical protein [Pantoea agglomerans]|uniref:hypothetical protein n=1 Tax=Enterobacter agglomerans TaxID=549 RepID=UPI0012DB1AE7|nr:hypothetical protein [Pantoea agglomerans]